MNINAFASTNTKQKVLFTLVVLLFQLTGFAQDWSEAQLEKANTAADAKGLSNDEQEAIMYINLARLYPKDFITIELEDVSDQMIQYASFVASLKKDLSIASPLPALAFDNNLFDLAKCFARESGKKGTVGHTRKSCPKGYAGECCSYGVKAGWDIALQWLIDDNVSNLGHRKNCLDPSFTRIGLSIQYHKKYGVCAVGDFGR